MLGVEGPDLACLTLQECVSQWAWKHSCAGQMPMGIQLVSPVQKWLVA
jgi:hypothetical protein